MYLCMYVYIYLNPIYIYIQGRIAAGDVLEAVDGQPVLDMPVEKVAPATLGLADMLYWLLTCFTSC